MESIKPDPPFLPPIDKFEMNRLVHARVQEMWVPGSPPGQSGHPQLSQAARGIFGVKSWADLSVDQMRAIYDFLESHKRLPRRGDI